MLYGVVKPTFEKRAGGVLSFTVTVKPQVEVLPAASVARCTTVVVPTGKLEPEASPDVRLTVGVEHTSVAVGTA
jgi:hypothetical protein